MEFRRATAEDAPLLATLINSAYRGESSKAGWTTEADLIDGQRTDAATLAAELADGEIEQYLALGDDAQILGTFRWETDPLGSDDGYVGMITVAPTGQRLGTGRQLLAEAERISRERDCPGLVMWVIAQRTELRAYYERRGYADTGHREPFPYGQPQVGTPKVDGLEFAILRKPLA